MMKNMKSYDKAFLTGADFNTEWMLPWFFRNYRRHNDTPIIFANFGVIDLESIRPHVHAIMDLTQISEQGWFKKPKAMIHSPSLKTVWLDSDCEVKDNLDPLFDLLEPRKLNMVEDKPWKKRRGGVQFNSGVVGYIGKPIILKLWSQWIESNPESGDQETLSANMDSLKQLTYINELPNEYNHLRLQIENDNQPATNAKIIHWTGAKGKERIRRMMND